MALCVVRARSHSSPASPWFAAGALLGHSAQRAGESSIELVNVKMRWRIHQFCGRKSFIALVDAAFGNHVHQFCDGDAATAANYAVPEDVAPLDDHETTPAGSHAMRPGRRLQGPGPGLGPGRGWSRGRWPLSLRPDSN